PLTAALIVLIGCDRGSKPALLNASAPDFTIQDAGRTVSLHDFRGKVVVLNFWATWCPPCVDEMPSLVALQAKPEVRDRVQILAVSLDQDESAYKKFLADYNISILTIRDPSQESTPAATGIPISLYTNAKKRFSRILRIVAALRLRARTIPRRSPITKVTSADSIATSVPVPIAIPTFACARAGASLMPSPAIATRDWVLGIGSWGLSTGDWVVGDKGESCSIILLCIFPLSSQSLLLSPPCFRVCII